MFTNLYNQNQSSFNAIKLFIAVLIFSVLFIPVSTFANNQPETKINRKPSKEISNIIEKTKKFDPQKPISQKLSKNVKDNNELTSDQKDLKIKFNLKNKKVKLENKDKGNITIGIPNQNQYDSVDQIDDKLVYTGKNSKTDIVIESVDGGMRQILNIKDNTAPNFYDFPVELETGEKIVLNQDGSALVKKANGQTKLTILKPWAKDANGKDLKTEYQINGNNLRQVIDFKGAVFPITADPAWCGNVVGTVNWAYDNTYGARYWMLRIQPTWCGRLVASSTVISSTSIHRWNLIINNPNAWSNWMEVYNKTPNCALYSGRTCVTIAWNKQWNTNQYWSMYNQFMCHLYNPATSNKDYWNIEPHRPDVGIVQMYLKRCNP